MLTASSNVDGLSILQLQSKSEVGGICSRARELNGSRAPACQDATSSVSHV